MLGKRAVGVDEEREQPRQVREVAGDQDVPRFAAQTVPDPLGPIRGLEILRSREFRQRVARAPEGLRRLARAQFPAVPHDEGPGTPRSRGRCDTIGLGHSDGRQRPAGVDLGVDRVSVMDQEEFQLEV